VSLSDVWVQADRTRTARCSGALVYRELFECREPRHGPRSWRLQQRVILDKKNEIRSVKRDGTALVVSVIANAPAVACARNPHGRPLPREHSQDFWVWTNPGNEPLARCICSRHLEFRVADVPDGDFTATAEAREK
jgi:hypothetical protein